MGVDYTSQPAHRIEGNRACNLSAISWIKITLKFNFHQYCQMTTELNRLVEAMTAHQSDGAGVR